MLREWCADIAAFLSARCLALAERLRKMSLRWNARARWFADVAEWLGTYRTWHEIRADRRPR